MRNERTSKRVAKDASLILKSDSYVDFYTARGWTRRASAWKAVQAVAASALTQAQDRFPIASRLEIRKRKAKKARRGQR